MQNPLAKPSGACLFSPASPAIASQFYARSQACGCQVFGCPLGLITVAALFPQHREFRLIDENVEPLADADLEWADIVLTGGVLPHQKGILTTIERAHAQGKPVVVGGPDPTSQLHVYEEVDFLVLGEGARRTKRASEGTPW